MESPTTDVNWYWLSCIFIKRFPTSMRTESAARMEGLLESEEKQEWAEKQKRKSLRSKTNNVFAKRGCSDPVFALWETFSTHVLVYTPLHVHYTHTYTVILCRCCCCYVTGTLLFMNFSTRSFISRLLLHSSFRHSFSPRANENIMYFFYLSSVSSSYLIRHDGLPLGPIIF